MATRRRAAEHSAHGVADAVWRKRGNRKKEFGESAVEAVMQQIGQLFAANIRQNDLAFRYETTIAIVLGETFKRGIWRRRSCRDCSLKYECPRKQEPVVQRGARGSRGSLTPWTSLRK